MLISGIHFSRLQHYANGLHVYCRLVDLHIPVKWAKRISKAYEKVAHWVIYQHRAGRVQTK